MNISKHGAMLDTNIFGRIIEGRQHIDELRNLGVPIYITHNQKDEIDNTVDATTKSLLLGTLNIISSQSLNTSSFILDISRLDMASLGDAEGYSTILNILDSKTTARNLSSKPKNNKIDALIAETAHHNNLTLLTDDRRLFEAASELSWDVVQWSDRS